MMRRYHRWVSIPLIIFLIAVTGTGIYLQAVEMMAAAEGSGPPARRTAPDREKILAVVDQALSTTEKDRPDFPVQKIEILFKGDMSEVKIATNKKTGPVVTFDSRTGDASYVERPARSLRTMFVLLHSGKYFGMIGLIVIMLASIVLMILNITGSMMYLEMYKRRRKAKKTELFWK